MKKVFKRIKGHAKRLILFSIMLFSQTQVAYADSLKDSKLVTGSQKLFDDATNALLWIIPSITVVLIILQIPKLQAADDEQEARPIKKRIKTIAMWGAGAFVVDSVIKIILNYFK